MTENVHLARAIGQITVKNSALNPLLWLSGAAAISFLPAAVFMPEIKGILVVAAIVPFIFTIAMYLYFACKDPDRLQSEEYRLQHQQMVMQGKRGLIEIGSDSFLPNPISELGDEL